MVRLWNAVIVGIIMAVVFKYASGYLFAAVDKAYRYLNDEESYSYLWEYIIGVSFLFQFVLVLYSIRRGRKTSALSVLVQYNIMLLLADIVFLFLNYSIFHRLNTFISMLMLPVISLAIDYTKKYHLEAVIRLLSWITLGLACLRGNLCGYKFFMMY